MISPRDITDAPTYADALEIVRRISAKYSARHSVYNLVESLISIRGGCGCAIAVFVCAQAFMLGPALLLLIPLEIIFLLSARRVKLEEGWLKIYIGFIRVRKINVADVYWVGTSWSRSSAKRYYYCTGGRRVSISGVYNQMEARRETLIHKALFELGKKKLAADADNTIEGETPVPVPLSEGATHRMLFWLGLGMIIVCTICSVALLLGWDSMLRAISRNKKGKVLELLLLVFTPAILGILAVIWGWIRFFALYRIRKQAFRPEGFFRSRREFFPYEKLKLTFYRGRARMYDPYPGVLEVRLPDETAIYIGPERQNFFVLPYVLEIWAGERFKLADEHDAPPGVAGIPYRDTLNLFLPFLHESQKQLDSYWKQPDTVDDIPDSELLIDEPEEKENQR